MRNLKCSIRKNILRIEIDLSKELGLTKSEQSIMIACSDGNAPLVEKNQLRPEVLNLNLFRKATEAEVNAIREGRYGE
jgi:hypothetical protein